MPDDRRQPLRDLLICSLYLVFDSIVHHNKVHQKGD